MAKPIAITGTESATDLETKIDSGDSYALDAAALTRFVSRYIADELNEADIEQIGNLLEGAEFIEYVGPGSDGLMPQVIFQMSTPKPNAPITKETAERWLGLLGD
jgi:hypothetical protein